MNVFVDFVLHDKFVPNRQIYFIKKTEGLIFSSSLKTEENLSVVKALPLNRLLLETDSPWCEIRPSHAGAKHVCTNLPAAKKEKWVPDKMVKGRNEPANIL